jgi:hypothetical protein
MNKHESIFNNAASYNSKGMSDADFNKIKQAAIKDDILLKTITLNDIDLTADSVRNKLITIAGKPIACDTSFFKGLSKILHVSSTLEKSIRKSSSKKEDTEFGDMFYSKLIDTLKTFKSSKTNKKAKAIQLIANPATHSITNIIEGDHKRVGNGKIFDIAEQLLNDYPTLELLDARNDFGDCGIKLLRKNETDFGNFGGPDGGVELFKFGMTIENSGLNTKMGDFSYRLVCENGMMGMKTINNFQLDSIESKDIEQLFKHIKEAEKRGFMPFAFAEHLELSSKINASYNEVQNAYDKTRKQLKISDPELKEHFAAALEEQYFPGLAATRKKVATAGLDPNGLTTKQMAFIDSGTNMWQLINTMTFLGSHRTGFDFDDADMIQKLAGKQFHAEYDLAYQKLMRL